MPERKVAAIHQPNFFPWLSYFDKITRCDVFVILDNVQFQKKGGTWSNRVKILINKKTEWITVPVNRTYHGLKAINEIEIDNSKPWREKVIRTIEANYGRAPYFKEVFPVFKELLSNPENNLSKFNIDSIKKLSELLNINTSKFIIASKLSSSGNATDLLIEIVREAGANAYMYGRGAMNYQENDKFKSAGIELIEQNFMHPVYQQFSSDEFVAGLSVIDGLMNVGFDGVKNLLIDN